MKSGEEFEAADLPWFLTLHWGWLLVGSMVLSVLGTRFHWTYAFWVDAGLVWSFLQAGWLMRMDQRSTAFYWYVGDYLLVCVGKSGVVHDRFPEFTEVALPVIATVIAIASLFHFRRDMMRYFKDTDDIDLKLSGWMTYFFSTPYFQYKFREVAQLQRSARLNRVAG